MAVGRRFGFHSGVVHALDVQVMRDLYVQDDIVFSDVSAGRVGVTGGIDMQSTTSAIGIDMGGTFTTTAIVIDGTCNGASVSALHINLDYDLLTIGSEYPKAIYVDCDQTSETVAGSGGMQGVRVDTNNNAFNNLWQVSVQGRATVSDATINDAIGVYASIKTEGAVSKYAASSSLCAFKGDVSDSPGSSWDANVHGVMIGYASQINYGGKTSLFFGYTHATAYCDYGLLIDNYSPNMTAGIYLTETTGASPAMTTGLHIDATCSSSDILIDPTLAAGSFKGIHIAPTLTGTQVAACAIDVDMDYSGGDINYYIADLDATQTAVTAGSYLSRGNITGVRSDVNAIGNIDHVWSARIGSSIAMAANSETNQFYGGSISAAASGAFTLTLHDGLVGAQIGVSVDSGVTDVTGGIITALFTNCSSVAKDTTSPIYGIFNKIGQYCDAAMNINTATGHNDGTGLLFDTDTQTCSLDSAMKFSNSSAAVTNLLDIGTSGNGPHSALSCATHSGASNSSIVIEVGGATKYIPVFDTAS